MPKTDSNQPNRSLLELLPENALSSIENYLDDSAPALKATNHFFNERQFNLIKGDLIERIDALMLPYFKGGNEFEIEYNELASEYIHVLKTGLEIQGKHKVSEITLYADMISLLIFSKINFPRPETSSNSSSNIEIRQIIHSMFDSLIDSLFLKLSLNTKKAIFVKIKDRFYQDNFKSLLSSMEKKLDLSTSHNRFVTLKLELQAALKQINSIFPKSEYLIEHLKLKNIHSDLNSSLSLKDLCESLFRYMDAIDLYGFAPKNGKIYHIFKNNLSRIFSLMQQSEIDELISRTCLLRTDRIKALIKSTATNVVPTKNIEDSANQDGQDHFTPNPIDALYLISKFCDPESRASLKSTCRFFHKTKISSSRNLLDFNNEEWAINHKRYQESLFCHLRVKLIETISQDSSFAKLLQKDLATPLTIIDTIATNCFYATYQDFFNKIKGNIAYLFVYDGNNLRAELLSYYDKVMKETLSLLSKEDIENYFSPDHHPMKQMQDALDWMEKRIKPYLPRSNRCFLS